MPAFKKIKDYSTEELNEAIEFAVVHCANQITPAGHVNYQLDFWKILNGIDSYFERRKRKEEAERFSKNA